MEPVYVDTAKVLKAISDPKRLCIIDMLSCGELCACRILEEFRIAQPTLSHDMRQLVDAGIVESRREGKNIFYRLNDGNLQSLLGVLKNVFDSAPDCVCYHNKGKECQ